MSWNVLIADGLEEAGIQILQAHGIRTVSQHLDAEALVDVLPSYQGIVVRSATQVRKALIDRCPSLRFIARAGVGLDNIDAEYAKNRGIAVLNTPASSSRSVAELALGHMLTLARGLQRSNRELDGPERFRSLKKQLSSSTELRDKVLLLVGFGRIGRELGQMAIGMGMDLLASDPFVREAHLEWAVAKTALRVSVPLVSIEEGLAHADYISLHAPYIGEPVIHSGNIGLCKPGAHLINTSRGENIDEEALLTALNANKLGGAGLDVFSKEPDLRRELIAHPKVSHTPHIGASTLEAQERIALELASQIVALCDKETFSS
ncbi:MAG: 3-phosphoglycerate dehydrogenase [Saprospiraceae bacterium]|jgi:D-3-phosphoglycerate dehydrogenase|nr:3-phosphoglycerate dehydrogenase [Saprospiraceae bacterium]MBP9211042.1 3-phosphoglycerate dehydrogenase [Saprospiraceae bacterium]MBV6474130.1 Hydroxypyruvate reductase [Saprospiraceae bacterium]